MSCRLLSRELPNMARALIASASFLSMGFSTGGLAQSAAQTVHLDIPAQNLSASLTQFARQTGTEIEFSPEAVREKKAAAVRGEFERDQALRLLLKGTGLTYRTTPQGAIVVEAQKTGARNTDQSYTPNPGAADIPSSSDQLEEIVVTAQKRAERLQDVPVPVTAINAESLSSTNLVRLQDYYTQVPGLTITPSEFNGSATISIRGITSGDFTNPTVGITVDDVPYGSTTALGGGYLVPDLDPSDLAQIEVLRGPQGTLYGASSLGGLLKYITVDPSTDGFSGRIQTGVDAVHNSAQLGYNVSGSVNLPLNDTLAMRASGFARRDPGYIDNVQAGRNDANDAEVSGAHLSVLWKPSEAFSLKLSALLQNSHSFGAPSVTVAPGLGALQQSFLAGTGYVDRKFQAYSTLVKAKLGAFDLTSVTGYSINNLNDNADYSSSLGACCTSGIFGVTGTPNTDVNRTNKLSQELRLAGPVGEHIDVLLGAFYTHEYSPFLEQFLAADSTTGETVGTLATFDWYVTYAEVAEFVDLTYRISDRLDIQFGARESQMRQSYAEVDSGPYVPNFEGEPSPLYFPEVIVRDHAFTYLVTPRFKMTPDLMVYARIASGYRPGGPNSTASVFGLPESFKPDRTKNYEIGLKGDFLDHRLSIDTSVFYIDWQDIQVSLIDPNIGLSYFANGTQAKSEGVELSVQARPIESLRVGGAITWNEAVLTQDFPSNTIGAVGAAGDRLPYTGRFSGNLTLEQSFPVINDVAGFAGGTFSYVGNRLGAFADTSQRQDLPAYARLDLRSGLRYRTWSGNVYLNNATDRRGVLGGGIGTLVPSSFQLIQPRTVGITVAKTF